MRWPSWIAVATLLTAMACARGNEAEVLIAGQPPVTVSDADLTAYLAWLNDHMAATNQHRADLETMSQRLAAKYSLAETHRVATDPELLALANLQRAAMQELEVRSPVSGVKRQALEEALGGIAPREFHPGKMIFSRKRDDRALATVRQRYGDAFVDWILARDTQIVNSLAP
jgi:hypothetical protein